MRKKLFLFLMIGVICMFNSYGCGRGIKYAEYICKDPELNITMDYIEGWLHREHRGINDNYVSVLFLENRKDKNFKAKISVTAKNISKIEVMPLSVDAVLDDTIGRRLKFKNAKLLSKSKISFLNVEAREILLSYKALDKLYSIDNKLIPVKERIIIFSRGNVYYLLRYENAENEFDKFSGAFSHVIKTIKFKDSK